MMKLLTNRIVKIFKISERVYIKSSKVQFMKRISFDTLLQKSFSLIYNFSLPK